MEQPDDPAVTMLQTIAVTLLTPMFLPASLGDLNLARRAARAMINHYEASGPVELLAVVQIIAFAIAGLNALAFSMAEELPATVALRAANCADRLSKAEMRHRKQLKECRQAPATAEAAPAQPDTTPESSNPETPASEASPNEVPNGAPAAAPRPRRQTPRKAAEVTPAMYAVVHGLPLPAGHRQVPPHVQTQWRHAFGEAAIRVADEFLSNAPKCPTKKNRTPPFLKEGRVD